MNKESGPFGPLFPVVRIRVDSVSAKSGRQRIKATTIFPIINACPVTARTIMPPMAITSPAMAAEITNHIWTIEEIVNLVR